MLGSLAQVHAQPVSSCDHISAERSLMTNMLVYCMISQGQLATGLQVKAVGHTNKWQGLLGLVTANGIVHH